MFLRIGQRLVVQALRLQPPIDIAIEGQPGGLGHIAWPVEIERPESDVEAVPDNPWVVIVWNDPINLMSYVTWVLRKLFGYSEEQATALMLDVHHKGRAVVSNGTREKAELDVFRLHEHGLWATMQHDGAGESS